MGVVTCSVKVRRLVGWLDGYLNQAELATKFPDLTGHRLSSGDQQSHWLGSLCSYYYIWGCRIVYAVSQVLWLGFLFWQHRGLYSALGRALSSLPCQGRRIEQAPKCVWLIYCGHNQAELLPGQTGPPTHLCRWAEPLTTIPICSLLQGRMLSAKV